MSKSDVKDNCPAWAEELIHNIRKLEIQLGNIPDSPSWNTKKDIDELHSRIFDTENADIALDESIVEKLFHKVANELHKENFTATQIASFINARVGYEGGPPYCNEEEVKETLS